MKLPDADRVLDNIFGVTIQYPPNGSISARFDQLQQAASTRGVLYPSFIANDPKHQCPRAVVPGATTENRAPRPLEASASAGDPSLLRVPSGIHRAMGPRPGF